MRALTTNRNIIFDHTDNSIWMYAARYTHGKKSQHIEFNYVLNSVYREIVDQLYYKLIPILFVLKIYA